MNIIHPGSYSAIAGGMRTTIVHNGVEFCFTGENGVKGVNVADILNVESDGTVTSNLLGKCQFSSFKSTPALTPMQAEIKALLLESIAANEKLARVAGGKGCDEVYQKLNDTNQTLKSYLYLLLTPEEASHQRRVDSYT